jgi:hypothetical protein
VSPKADTKVTVVAELTITSPSHGVETVRSFDKAWHTMRERGAIATPVNCRFERFVRKNEDE